MRAKSDERPYGRLVVDDSKDSTEAVRLLINAGFHILTVPVEDATEPSLSIGADLYHGLKEIKRIIKLYQNA